jgi:spoIIIJ-associated protein
MDAALVKEALGSLLTHLNLPFDSIELADGKGFTRIDIRSASASRIIGWHGETLNSIQHLLKAIVRTKEQSEKSPFLVLDIEGYRRDQEEKVCKAAERKADFVRRTGNRVALPPMSPYFRRIVHLYVANTPALQDLTTVSTGEGEYRQIVLQLKEKRAGQEEQGGELSPVISESGDSGLENLDI